MNKTIEELFYCFSEGREGIYKPPLTYGESDEQREKVYEDIGLTIEQQNELDDIIAGCSSFAERHGFEQGLKLGLKQGIAAGNDESKRN